MSEGTGQFSGDKDDTEELLRAAMSAREREAIAHRERSETQAKLAAIVESSDDAIISKTLEGIIVTWNNGAERIFGYKPQEIIGRPIATLLPPERLDEETEILRRLRNGERIDHFETVRMTKDGRRIDVSVTISPVRNEEGRITGASKILRDITLSKQIMRELKAAKDAAESASRAKDHFLSILSHELRTPLTPVLFSLSAMEDRDDLPMELRQELAVARRNVETEARLVDDLLDLTRISRSKVKLHLEVVDIHQSVQRALKTIHTGADAKGLEMVLALDATKHFVWGDSGRLQQILLNLLSNAVKFTPEGGKVYVTSVNPEEDRVQLQITDTGIGMDGPALQRVFQPFEQADPGIARRFGGLGLGLSIARSLIELHGGSLTASSLGPGRGSTFTLAVDTVDPAMELARGEEEEASGALPALRILLVEDHRDTRVVVTRLLGRLGCTVSSASNVKEALALADLHSFDLLISDIGLPDGSGLEVMRHLKSLSDIKGIALSGYGQEEDVRRSEEAGFTVHLTKPIDIQKLEKTIQRLGAV